MKFFTATTALLLLFLPSFSQNGVIIYADLQKGDSADNAVQQLRSSLQQALPGEYPVQSIGSYKNTGILLLTTAQAVSYKIKIPATLKNYGPEGIYISGDTKTVMIAGNTGLALRQAVYFYLEQLGFHQFLPGREWKITPSLKSPYRKMALLTRPDYEYRLITNGHGYANSFKIDDDFHTWAVSNRMGGSFIVKTGHSYEEIVQRNEGLFKKHPEYFGQSVPAGTIPSEFKFNVGNKELVEFIIKDAFYRFEMQRKSGDYAPMLSMEPSDGGKYCNKPECLKIGAASDQAFYLTNKVAKAFKEKHPGIWLGMYAYNQHIMPPKEKPESNIFVAITNGFNQTRYSTTELMQLWKAKVKKLGIYDYTSVYEWDFDLPGQVTAAKVDVLKKNVQKFYKNGASVYMAESVTGWISKGPGQYVLSRLLWNINVNTDSVLNVFFNTAFENAAPQIRQLYKAWENYPYPLPSDNDMADWLKLTDEAYKKTNSAAVKSRIDLIKIYLQYLVLYRNLRATKSEEDLLRVMSYAYRTFETTSFPTLAVLVSLPNYYSLSKYGWYMGTDQPWRKDKRPVTNEEIQASFNQALQSIRKTEGVKAYAPATAFVKLTDATTIPSRKFMTTPHALWYPTEYIIQVPSQSAANFIEISSDYSAQLPSDKLVEIAVYPLNGVAGADGEEKPLLKFEQAQKAKTEKFSLSGLKAGTYRLVVDDRRKVFILKFSQTLLYSFNVSPGKTINATSLSGLNWFYFYVPPGVKRFQLTKTNSLLLESPTGRLIDKQAVKDETFFVDVQPGESGIWTIGRQGGIIGLEGVPPYLGDHPSTMLVPSYLKK